MKRIGVIGLDGMSRNYLDKLISNGAMPYTKHIVNKANIVTDLYAYPPVTPASWPSIMSGVSPAVHGIYDFFYYMGGNKTRLFTTYDLEHPRIHEMFSFLDKETIVINPIPSYPIIPMKKINVLSLEFFTPRLTCYPENLEKYVKIFEKYKEGYVQGLDGIFEKAYKHLNGYIEILEDMLSHSSFTVIWINLHYPDAIFHKASKSKEYDILDSKTYKGEIRVFNMIDHLIKLIDENVDDLVITSDHGFAKYTMHISINTLLEKNGLIIPTMHGITSSREKVFKEEILPEALTQERVVKRYRYNMFIRILRNPLIKPISSRAKNVYEKITGKKIQVEYPDVDPIKSHAFLFSRSSFGIFVNKEEVIEKVIKAIKVVKGVKHVWRKTDIFSGPFINRLPDLYVYPDFDQGYTLADTKLYDRVVTRAVSLDHHPLGLLIVKNGCGVKVNEKVLTNSIVTPLIQTILKLPISVYAEAKDEILSICDEKPSYTPIYFNRWQLLKKMRRIKTSY